MTISEKITAVLFTSKIDKLHMIKNDPYLNVYKPLIEHIRKVHIEDINTMISIWFMVGCQGYLLAILKNQISLYGQKLKKAAWKLSSY